MSKSENNILASFCYFSVFFAPFIFPLIVWIFAGDDTSRHAGKALLYHILPIILLIVSAVIFSAYGYDHHIKTFAIGAILGFLAVYYVIKNLCIGLKLLFS